MKFMAARKDTMNTVLESYVHTMNVTNDIPVIDPIYQPDKNGGE